MCLLSCGNTGSPNVESVDSDVIDFSVSYGHRNVLFRKLPSEEDPQKVINNCSQVIKQHFGLEI